LLYQSIDEARTCFPPSRLIDYAQFEEAVLCRYGDKIGDYIQIWNEQNNPSYWRHDPKYHRFACMARLAAEVAQGHGKKAVLGSIIPPYGDWIRLMRKYGVLELYDAVAIHAFPGTWDKMDWVGWRATAELVRGELDGQELWVTETGLSAVTLEDQSNEMQVHRESEQIAYFKMACDAPVERIFWHCAMDQALDHPTDNYLNRGTPCDPRAYYFGLVSREGRRKPLFRHWQSLTREACVGEAA
jgi:CDP-paratose 2-epimerase